MIRLFTPKVYAALQSQISAAVHAARTRGIQSAQGNIHGDVINTEIGAVITDLYHAAALLAKKKYRPEMKAGFGSNDSFIDEVLNYFRQYLLEKVVNPISQTTHKFIESVLQKAITEGWGVDKTVKELEDSDITKNRARMIVRTETVRASNFTQTAQAASEDFEMEKGWIAIEDNRTRRSHSHAGVDGERQQLDQPYSNGLMFPGDPEADAEETINCRCTQGFFASRDNDGRLIPKERGALNFLSQLNVGRQ